jgi:hypothetical protein
MSLNRFSYTGYGIIKDHLVDGYYLWILFTGVSGSTKLMKVSALDPSVIYYELTLTIDDGIRLKIDGSYLYVLADDDTYIAVRITRTNPIGTELYYTKPVAETEDPVDMVVSNFVYILMPGEISGEYAIIYKFSKTSDTLSETITLNLAGNALRNASTMDIDTSTETLHIATNESPLSLGRLLYNSGWILTTWEIS